MRSQLRKKLDFNALIIPTNESSSATGGRIKTDKQAQRFRIFIIILFFFLRGAAR